MQASRRRVAFFSAAVASGALAALPQLANASLLAPDSAASEGASSARTMYVIMAIVGFLIVIGVVAALLRALRGNPSARRNDESVQRRTRGTSSVQKRVAGALGAFALVLFVVAIIFSGKTTEVEASAEATPITISAVGQQWIWRYQYPAPEETEDGFASDAPYSYYRLVIPVDTPIDLEVSSIDVMHRWSVPALAPAADAVPGLVNEVSFMATETGSFEGRSTRFSGAGYSTMRTVVEVVEQEEYEAFLQEKVDGIKEARAAVNERVQEGTAPGVSTEE